MTPHVVGLIAIGILLILLFIGIPVGYSMILAGVIGYTWLTGLSGGISVLGLVPPTTINSYVLSVLPLFLLMGYFGAVSGMGRDFYECANRWLGHLPGGLAIASVMGCAGFSAICGSSVATAATMGAISLPEMKKYRYDPALATGALAAGGTLGILIPPSTVFVIYGLLTEQSIGKLFIAGIVPGLFLAAVYMVQIYIQARLNPLLGPAFHSGVTMKDRFTSLVSALPLLVLFLLVMGGIYGGFFSPTEAAGIGAFGAFLYAISKRRFNRHNFAEALLDTGQTTAMAFMLVIGGTIFARSLAVSRLPFTLAAFLAGLPISPYLVIMGIAVLLLILGCIMDSFAMILLTTPIFYPVILALHFDPIWFGVITVILVEAGMITPPVGVNVFVISQVAGNVPLFTVFRGIGPFVISMILGLLILTAFPQIVMFLPNLMY